MAGMDIVKVGGPVYRIGVGGGSASSVQVSVHSFSHNPVKWNDKNMLNDF